MLLCYTGPAREALIGPSPDKERRSVVWTSRELHRVDHVVDQHA